MKVLWFTNLQIFPEDGVHEAIRGGWMIGTLNYLVRNTDYEIAIVSPNIGDSKESGIVYFGLKYDMSACKFDDSLKNRIKDIYSQFNPDIIHVWGTEYIHSYAAMVAAEDMGITDRIVVNLQGVIGAYSERFIVSIPSIYIKGFMPIEILTKSSIRSQKIRFEKLGEYEKCTLRKCKNVIGKSYWDESYTRMINSECAYYKTREILRDNFYDVERWNVKQSSRLYLFMSQASYPIKGLHIILDALNIVKEKYPNIELHIAGDNFFHKSRTHKWIPNNLLYSSYDIFLLRKIRKYGLEKNIIFEGNLTAAEMIKRYKKSRMVISASTIENESNTISEARIIGTPVISSFVGGVTERINNGVDGFVYPCEEYYVLAQRILDLIEDDELATKISVSGIEIEKDINNIERNGKQMCYIYSEVKKQIHRQYINLHGDE